MSHEALAIIGSYEASGLPIVWRCGLFGGMGMDGVEIVMAVEERFGVTIPDSEAELARTPGMLVDLVMAKMSTSGIDACRTQRAFHLTRRFLVKRNGIARDAIRLGNEIRQIIVREDERKFWGDLRLFLSAKRWPDLDFSSPTSKAILGLALGMFVVGTFLSWGRFGSEGILIGILAAIVTVFFISRGFGGFRRYIPARIVTIRDLAMVVGGVIEEGSWNQNEVEFGVEKIVSEVLGLKPGVYRSDADFVKELGLC
jgi:hypothetical protein